MTFEAQMKRLSEITQLLEKGELSLEKSVQLYQEGLGVAMQCQKELDAAKQQLTIEEHPAEEKEALS